ncbi:helix-hairpin-helix domain-containing protein [Clostridium lundense]|uniref:helix-hairpin-helix domain-containing protein n=1 Tax=Clostridium lundense TaxID=319475 RepID=UPI000481AB84|nr:helix-hairpin-helix domain-containing protein [Clostridium lundense]
MKEKKKIIGSIVILLVFIFFISMGYIASLRGNKYKEEEVFTESIEKESSNTNIIIYVNGEVKKPGVYELKENSRIEDAIKIAGGFSKDADRHKLNLAKKIKDEDYIYVDKIKKDNDSLEDGKKSVNNSGKININEASKEELKSVPGIGDVTAQKIIEYRESNNGFNSVEDIKKVDRIGEKTFEKLKDKIDVR